MSFSSSDFSSDRQQLAHVPVAANTVAANTVAANTVAANTVAANTVAANSDVMKVYPTRFVCLTCVTLAILLVSLCGCGKKELEQLKSDASSALNTVTEKAKETTDKVAAGVEKATNTIQEAVGPGSISITLDSPVSGNACFAHFIQQAPTRPNVLKLQSHLDMKSLQYPATLIQIQMDSSIDKMVGQTVDAAVYIQATADGPIWTGDDSEKVQAQIASVTEKTVKVQIVGGKLTSTSGKTIAAVGSLEGILQ